MRGEVDVGVQVNSADVLREPAFSIGNSITCSGPRKAGLRSKHEELMTYDRTHAIHPYNSRYLFPPTCDERSEADINGTIHESRARFAVLLTPQSSHDSSESR